MTHSINPHKQFTKEFGQLKCSRFNRQECESIKQSLGLCDFDESKQRCVASYKILTDVQRDESSSSSSRLPLESFDGWNTEIQRENPKRIAFDSTNTTIDKSFFLHLLRLSVKYKCNYNTTKYLLRIMYLLRGPHTPIELVNRFSKLMYHASIDSIDLVQRAAKSDQVDNMLDQIKSGLTKFINTENKLQVLTSLIVDAIKLTGVGTLVVFMCMYMYNDSWTTPRYATEVKTTHLNQTWKIDWYQREWMDINEAIKVFNEACKVDKSFYSIQISSEDCFKLKNAFMSEHDKHFQPVTITKTKPENNKATTGVWNPQVVPYPFSPSKIQYTCKQSTIEQLPPDFHSMNQNLLGYTTKEECQKMEQTKVIDRNIDKAMHTKNETNTGIGSWIGERWFRKDAGPIIGSGISSVVTTFDATPTIINKQVKGEPRGNTVIMGEHITKEFPSLIKYFNFPILRVNKDEHIEPRMEGTLRQLINNLPKGVRLYTKIASQAILQLCRGHALLNKVGLKITDLHEQNIMYKKIVSDNGDGHDKYKYVFKFTDLDTIEPIKSSLYSKELSKSWDKFTFTLLSLLLPNRNNGDGVSRFIQLHDITIKRYMYESLTNPLYLHNSDGSFEFLYLLTEMLVRFEDEEFDAKQMNELRQEQGLLLHVNADIILQPKVIFLNEMKSRTTIIINRLRQELKVEFKQYQKIIREKLGDIKFSNTSL